MLKVFIDIETLPEQNPNMEEYKAGIKAPAQYKKQESIDKWLADNTASEAEKAWLKTSFDGGKGQICCIGVGIVAELDQTVKTYVGSEVEMLTQLNEFIQHYTVSDRVKPEVMFIAHNAKFDLPFLHKRFVINQIEPQFKTVWHGRHGQHHY